MKKILFLFMVCIISCTGGNDIANDSRNISDINIQANKDISIQDDENITYIEFIQGEEHVINKERYENVIKEDVQSHDKIIYIEVIDGEENVIKEDVQSHDKIIYIEVIDGEENVIDFELAANDEWGVYGPKRFINGFYLKDQTAFLYWSGFLDETGYIISYGNSADYEYSIETSEPKIIITGIDTQKTWYTALQVKKGDKTSPILVRFTLQGLNEPSQLQLFSSSELAKQKLAWESLKITKYRTGNHFYVPMFAIGSSFESIYNLTVIPNSEPKLSVIKESGIKESGKYGLYDDGFFELYGKTIDELFGCIDAYAAVVGKTITPFFIQYDETYHYPRHLTVGFPLGGPGGGMMPTFSITFNVLE